MFSNALKSISSSSSNISSNYTVATQPTSTAGPWKIYDAKKKSTGKAYSVFVFDRKAAIDHHASANGLGRSGASALRKAADEVVERLKREAASLARLRHPSVLELVEPVEDTRGGGLQFATEAVTASLASLLQEKDDEEGRGGGGSGGGRSGRFVTEDAGGVRRRRELEIDELEIQKGLLQLGKALEFLHDNAGLVHGNLTPDAVLVNAKGDWKISGLSFCGPADPSSNGGPPPPAASASFQPVSVHEMLNMDVRLPRSVQLSLDFASPDLVLDNNRTPSTDMFSLGLVCIALYNTPHRSPLEPHGSVSAYRRLFASSSTTPTAQNNYLSKRPLPRELAHSVLPRLVARRPAQRMTAREFQTSEYFDNILVSTIRFLDAFPAKTSGEKSAFFRGLLKVLPSFPKSVMEKKLLPALLDELKDRELAPQILQNVFRMIDLLPSAKRAFPEKVLPALKDLFFPAGTAAAAAASSSSKHGKHDAKDQAAAAAVIQERDPVRDASLMVVLDRLSTIANNTNGKEFRDDVLPIVATALESTTPSVVDAALRCIPVLLPVLDFSTIKHELFPVVATIFSKTNSLAIKVRGLQAFVILCGGTLTQDENDDDVDNLQENDNDGLNGFAMETKKTSSSSTNKKKSTSSSTALDKYTMQEKIVPLIRAIKTKEPAVMMEALAVLRVVGRVADVDFVAMDVLPILWHMSLGPLLNLGQFQAFMRLIKSLSRRVEEEQTKKLQELSGDGVGGGSSSSIAANTSISAGVDAFSPFGTGSTSATTGAFDVNGHGGGEEDDFERLVKGKSSSGGGGGGGGGGFAGGALMDAGFDSWSTPAQATTSTTAASHSSAAPSHIHSPAAAAPTFSWSTPPSSTVATPSIMPPSSSYANAKPLPATASTTTTTTAAQSSLGSFPSMVPSSTQFSQALPARPLNSSQTTPVANAWSSMASPTTTTVNTGINWSAATKPAAANPWASSSSSSGGGGSSFSLQPPPAPFQQQQQQQQHSPASAFSLPPPPGSSSALSGGWGSGSNTASTTTSSTMMNSSFQNNNLPAAPNYNRANLGMLGTTTTTTPTTATISTPSTNTAAVPPGMNMNLGMGMGMNMGSSMMPTQPGKSGLDKYESLL